MATFYSRYNVEKYSIVAHTSYTKSTSIYFYWNRNVKDNANEENILTSAHAFQPFLLSNAEPVTQAGLCECVCIGVKKTVIGKIRKWRRKHYSRHERNPTQDNTQKNNIGTIVPQSKHTATIPYNNNKLIKHHHAKRTMRKSLSSARWLAVVSVKNLGSDFDDLTETGAWWSRVLAQLSRRSHSLAGG